MDKKLLIKTSHGNEGEGVSVNLMKFITKIIKKS